MLNSYPDLLANVRRNGYSPIRQLVEPDHPEVKRIANVLKQAPNPIDAAQEFVNRYAEYSDDTNGDYWETVEETLEWQLADCDGKAILLCSILRNFLEPEEVWCVGGLMTNGDEQGHMWVAIRAPDGSDKNIESTLGGGKQANGTYRPMFLFNDKYALASPEGLKEFDLKPVIQAGRAAS